MIFAVLCTGPSMSLAIADSVRHLPTIAVNQAYELAPDAVAVAAIDARWWTQNPKAKLSTGRKFAWAKITDVESIQSEAITSGTCSGVLALEVAKMMGATRVLMLGLDFHGTHYFGPYANPLNNTSDAYRRVHRHQFKQWGRANPQIEVLNCTEGSQLDIFPLRSLDACLAESSIHDRRAG